MTMRYRSTIAIGGAIALAACSTGGTGGEVKSALSAAPAKTEAPYRLVAALALIVFGIEGLLIGNPILKLLAYAVTAVPILGIAWLTMRKV